MDGGSLTLIFDDINGHEKRMTFSQHINLKYYKELNDKLPGRIYVNNVLVEKRSKEESDIIKHLENKIIKYLSTNETELLLKSLKFVKSQKYLTNIPVNQYLTETRRKYIQSIEKELTYKLNRTETKYAELYNGILSIEDFENWVYNNETKIVDDYNQSIYDSLIILNYKRKHAKTDLKKILDINFRKIELASLHKYLIKLSKSNKPLLNVGCMDWEYYDYYFSFEIENIWIGLKNPFNLTNSHYSISNQKRIDEFIKRFQDPALFFALIKSELNTENVRLVVDEEIKELQPRDMNEGFYGTKEELFLQIEKHRLILNKEFVKTKMTNYWL